MEMLSGFRALRGACPMNLRRHVKAIPLPEGVTADVARIDRVIAAKRDMSDLEAPAEAQAAEG